MGAIRLSLGRGTTREDIDLVVERLTNLLITAG
jgi:cysteine sulfinate desulfinase/cysteine desulfurase-like protein